MSISDGGSVLGASTGGAVLANTGVPIWISTLFALGMLIVIGLVHKLRTQDK